VILAKPFVKLAKRLHRNKRDFERFSAHHKGRKFLFDGKKLEYLWEMNHWTWLNERCVEVPIARDYVEQYGGKRILEVGNELWKYFPTSHDVVDKYETGQGDHVLNQDIIDYRPTEKYDFIISVSTIEHIGWDEKPRDPTKLPRTIEHLRTMLEPGGRIVLTFPIGYNPHLTEMVRAGRLPFSNQFFFKRTSWQNDWSQVGFEAVERAKYGSPFYYANAIAIAVIDG
jgi:SAM-dependent methyltransferase